MSRVLTIADRHDEPEHNEGQQHAGGETQQQDEEQTDAHGYHQTTAETPTHQCHQ